MAEYCWALILLESYQRTGVNPRSVLNYILLWLKQETADTNRCTRREDVQKTGASKWSYYFITDVEDRVHRKAGTFLASSFNTKMPSNRDNHLLSINQTNMVKALNQLPLNQLFRWTNELHSLVWEKSYWLMHQGCSHQQSPSGAKWESLLPSSEHICSKSSFDPKPAYAVIF